MKRREFIKLGCAAGLGAMGAGPRNTMAATREGGMKQPNILFVMADQWRRHSVGFMNEDPVITPNLDRFAEEGRAFTNAVTCIPICSPWRASMLTGRYPLSNTVIANNIMLPPEQVSIANILKDSGYATGYIGKWHLDGDPWNHFTPPGPRRQGFDYWYANGCHHHHFSLHYWADDPEPITGMGWQPDHETDKAIEFIESRDKSRPFGLFISWAPPHTIHGGPRFNWPEGGQFQYAAPERFEALYRGKDLPRRPNVPGHFAEEALPGHFGAITSLDENFGRLLDCLEQQGLAEDTIVVFTTDHGEMLGSHELMTKGIFFEESIGVPFLIRWPGNVRHALDDRLFNSVDIMPSLLGLAGLPIPDSVEGTDFSAVMRGESDMRPSSALITFFKGAPDDPDDLRPWRCLRTERYTYVVGQRSGSPIMERLYDNQEDPYQLNSLDGQDIEPALRKRLRAELHGWLVRTNDPWEKHVAG